MPAANPPITLSPPYDGVQYAKSFTIPASEGDVFNGAGNDPIAVIYNQSFLAVVSITYAGSPSGNSGTYIVAQTSVDNGTTWIDVAWIKDAALSGTVTYVLSNGLAGANAYQQNRAAGTSPSTSGSQQIPLGGSLRFIGQSTLTGGTAPTAKVTISFKLMGLR